MFKSLKIVVDGVIYQLQSNGGISRLYSETLPRICNLDKRLRIFLLTEGRIAQTLPHHGHIFHKSIPQIEPYLRPGRLWKPVAPTVRELMGKLQIGCTKGAIWHSTYYTMPPNKWRGPVLVTVADMIHERLPHLFSGPWYDQFREQKRRSVLAADVVICISEATRQDLQCFYNLNSDSVQVIHLAHSDIFKRQEYPAIEAAWSIEKRPFLLYVGLRAHYKNFEGLIRAYSVWPQRNDVTLVVVGKPWTASEEAYLAALGIQGRVQVLTGVDDKMLLRLYNQAVALVYPSLYEGFGIPLLEAMACGCPVIASRIPSTVEVAGEQPIYFEPVHLESLLAAFDLALAEGRNSERVRTGLEHAQDFSWDKTSSQVLEVYHALSNSN
jgi:glycosyltransferase involved in cell wall biosynthesis